MSSDQDFLQQNANKFLSEVNNFHLADNDPANKQVLKAALFEKLKEYDNEFYKRFNKVPLSELANQFTQQQNYRDLPDQSTIQQNLMKNTFVSDAGYLTRYQRLHKTTTQNPVTQPLNVVEQPIVQRNFENEFINTKFNFKDTNLNQKSYLSNPNLKIEQNNFMGNLELNELDSNKYQQDLLALMKQPQIVEIQDQVTIQNHKSKIEQLGGIEDTVAVMERSLNELQNQTQQTRSHINNQASIRQPNYQQADGQSDYFLKEYTQRQGNVNQVIEKSKLLREQMLRKIQQI
ncbi:hypothetical protein TTHERM_00938840 (macronuclear) [Tetrahymena thermophila SB210]|uniref:Uncharacterized protein n=1 Tax=Tetrahymena thermophila (strain SB210) TaxID=312017 RepID=Q22DQ8_TETTS|nr:hypothetical protein TTHERM_00938840 [Tetrahymena thermophila SB210]EAR83396.2 hypothetical protein TTHERM_00938840 [Tetrahymena thermophila SB210]|eukprot:XP_001031059.2 hypothetical protein TTHERM_00938840 [Tetrahymena thermophila SB210]